MTLGTKFYTQMKDKVFHRTYFSAKNNSLADCEANVETQNRINFVRQISSTIEIPESWRSFWHCWRYTSYICERPLLGLNQLDC